MKAHKKDIKACEARTPITWRKVVVIFALMIFAYSSAINGGFIWDDDSYVTNNFALCTSQGFSDIWLKIGTTPQYYPLVFTIFWTAYHLWGLNPLGYHLVNVVLHFVSALLVWLVLLHLQIPGAFWAASIFALHPVHVESVAWITELKNVLSGVFYLLSFLFYFKFLESEERHKKSGIHLWWRYGVSLFFFLCALLSKTVTATLPAAILLVLWWKKGRFPWREMGRLFLFFILAVWFGKLTVGIEKSGVGAMGEEWDFSFVERILIAGSVIWFYFAKLIWPHPLIFTYPRWDINAGVWWQYFFPIAVVGVLFGLWRLRKAVGRGPLTAALFFIGTLFPALGFFNVYPMRFSYVADHFQYLASLGIITLFSAAVHHGLKKKGWLFPRPQEYAILGVILFTFSVLIWRQGWAYQNVFTIFTDVINKNPTSWMAYNNRGVEFLNRNLLDQAFVDFHKAIEIKPDYTEAYHNLGLVYAAKKDYEQALANFNWALRSNPRFFMGYANRGLAYTEMGKRDLAILDYNRALKINPMFELGYIRRGTFYAREKKYDLALADFNRAVKINPYYVDAYVNRGQIYLQQKAWDLALREYNKALAVWPQSPDAHFWRSQIFEARGDFQKAYDDLTTAQRFGYPVLEKDIQRVTARLVEVLGD